MKRKISPREIELLSLYLDQQLEAGQRARLEARLRTDSELHAAYQDLRQTRAYLRSLPRLKAPRNFTLTPEMVGQARAKPARARRIYPVFQFASALASVLLMVVLLGDFLGFGISAPGTSTLLEPGIAAIEEAPAGEESQTLRASGPAGTEQPGSSTKMMPAQAAEGTGEAGEDLEILSAPPLDFSPTITTSVLLSDTASATMAAPISPQLGDQAVSESQAESEPSFDSPEAWIQRPSLTVWRAAEISLAVLALASGLAAIFLRKRYGARG
jgi:hypothetical protein